MKQSILLRIVIYIVIAFSILNGWWFIVLPILIFGIWKYSFVIEILITGVVYDALFGMGNGMGIKGYIGTIVACVIMLSVYFLKKIVR